MKSQSLIVCTPAAKIFERDSNDQPSKRSSGRALSTWAVVICADNADAMPENRIATNNFTLFSRNGLIFMAVS
jgi:hypothetical protein